VSALPLLESAASGMAAQRFALDIAARNVAAAEAAGPRRTFSREIPVFRVEGADDDARVALSGTRVAPGAHGDVVGEMLAVMNAARAYDADAAMFETGKRLALQTIDLERLP